MSEIISLVFVIIACVFMMYAIYKGLSMPLAAIIATIVIAVTSGLNIDETWTTCLESAVLPLVETYMGLWIFGGIMGYLYGESGAAASLAFFLFRPLKKIQNRKLKMFAYMAMFMVVRLLLGLTGIESMAVMILVMSIIIAFFKEMDIPRKYVNCMMICGTSCSGCLPYAPVAMNVIIPIFVPEWTASTYGGLRMIWTIAFIVIASLWMSHMILRDQDKGIHFEMGSMQNFNVEDDPTKRPHWALSFIPIIVVLVLYNFVGCSAWLSTAGGAVASALLFFRHLDLKDHENKNRGKFGMFIEHVNTSALTIPLYFTLTGILAGVVTLSPAYNLIIELCENIVNVMPPVVGFGIVSVVLVIMGNSAVYVAANLGTTVFAAAGLSGAAAGTMILMGNTVLNTLPHSAEMSMQAQLSDTPLKEGYPPIFKTTVLLTLVMMIVFTALIAIGITF